MKMLFTLLTVLVLFVLQTINVNGDDKFKRQISGKKHHQHEIIINNEKISSWRGLVSEMLLTKYMINRDEHGDNNSVNSSLHRSLKSSGDGGSGAFDELNGLLEGLVLKLPDAEFKADLPWPLTSVDITVKELQCFNVSIDDLSIQNQWISSKERDVTISTTGVRIECELKWTYDYNGGWWLGWVEGSGSAYVKVGDSDFASTISFVSNNLEAHPPHSSSVKSCSPNIEILDMDFSGGIAGSIADTFEKSLRNRVEDEIEAAVCEELGDIGTVFLQDMINFLESFIEQGIEWVPTDPLEPENNLVTAPGVQLIDFLSDGENGIGSLIVQLSTSINQNFGSILTGENNEKDLGINFFIREGTKVLNDDGSVDIPLSIFEEVFEDNVLFEGHDMITQTTVHLDAVKLYGLDHFTKFDMFVPLGSQTITNFFAMSDVKIVVKLRVHIKPSVKEGSVISEPSTPHVTESIVVEVGAKTISTSMTLLTAIDTGKVNLTEVMGSSNILGCIFSSFHVPLEITQFELKASDFYAPTLDGFISEGLDKLITDASYIAFLLYKPGIRKALSGISDGKLRPALNNFFEFYFSQFNKCPAGDLDSRRMLRGSLSSINDVNEGGQNMVNNLLRHYLKSFIHLDDDA